MNKENEMVAKVGTEEPSEEEKLSFLAMESNDQDKQTDIDVDGFTMLSVVTEYRNTDDWSKSQYGTVAQEWDPSLYRIRECESERLLDLEGLLDNESRPWYGLVWTSSLS